MALLDLGESRKELRWPLLIEAVIYTGGNRLKAAAHDLSSVGCRIECDGDLPARGYVLIQLKGLSPLDGQIVWSSGNIAGIVFQPPLHPAVLDHLVCNNLPEQQQQ